MGVRGRPSALIAALEGDLRRVLAFSREQYRYTYSDHIERSRAITRRGDNFLDVHSTAIKTT